MREKIINKNSLDYSSKNQEIEKEIEEFTQELMNDFGFSRERAERWSRNHFKIAIDLDKEFGEEIVLSK